jgi:hypothetical protein
MNLHVGIQEMDGRDMDLTQNGNAIDSSILNVTVGILSSNMRCPHSGK